MTAQIVVQFEMAKGCKSLCLACKHKDKGCEMKGRHVDAVKKCFMYERKVSK
jgi:hypothetical protein